MWGANDYSNCTCTYHSTITAHFSAHFSDPRIPPQPTFHLYEIQMGWSMWPFTSPDSTQSQAKQPGGDHDQAKVKQQRLDMARQKWQDTQDSAIPSSKAAAPDTTADDPEMRKFLEEVMGEVKSMRDADAARAAPDPPPEEASGSKKIKVSPWGSRWSSTSMSEQTAPSPQPSTDPDDPTDAPRLSPLAESLLPTTMNCETAFNLAFHCRSLGGQFTNLYRYGEVRSCNEHWSDFWFCMRAKGFEDGKLKEDAIREHYRNKELAKYGPGKPSSEDIWRERREPLPPGGAFAMPVPAATHGDAEFQKWQMERMESIRKGLKEKDGS